MTRLCLLPPMLLLALSLVAMPQPSTAGTAMIALPTGPVLLQAVPSQALAATPACDGCLTA